MIQTLRNFASDESGATAIEATLMVAVGAAVVLAFASALADSYSASMSAAADSIRCATTTVCVRD